MNKFEATGINVSHMNEYLHVLQNQGMDVILFFVDEHPKSESIYCQALSELIKPKTVDNVNKFSQLSTLISTSFIKAFISVFKLFPHIHTSYYDVY